jgi:hypothetical protein
MCRGRRRHRASKHRSRDVLLEPISKSPEEDDEAGKLNETEEVLGVIFPALENAALPLDPSEEALDKPAPLVSAEPAPVLRGRLAPV